MKKYVEVTGTGVATAPPDRIDLSLTITAVRPGVGAALDQVNEQVARLGAVLREHGVAPTDLRTTGSAVFEEYAGADNARAGFRASHDLNIQIASLDNLSAVFAAAVETIGDDFRLNQLNWVIADPSELISRARAAAFDDARAKASELADLAGASLGGLLRISESTGGYGPLPRFALASAGFAPEPGSNRVEITVATRWSLGNLGS